MLIIRSPRADFDATNAIRCPIYADVPAAQDIPAAGVPLKLTEAGWAPAVAGDVVLGWSSREAKAGNLGPFAEPVTAYGSGARFHYTDTPMVRGTLLYLTEAPGVLGTVPNGLAVAFAISARDIVVRAFDGVGVVRQPEPV